MQNGTTLHRCLVLHSNEKSEERGQKLCERLVYFEEKEKKRGGGDGRMNKNKTDEVASERSRIFIDVGT